MGKLTTPYYTCPMVTTAKITGMASAHCVRAVFTALGGVPGISAADVSLGTAVIDHDGTVTRAAIAEAVAIVGYKVASTSDSRHSLPVV